MCARSTRRDWAGGVRNSEGGVRKKGKEERKRGRKRGVVLEMLGGQDGSNAEIVHERTTEAPK